MSELSDLRQLEGIVQARYQHQQQSFGRLVAEENRLRDELARLDRFMAETRRMPRDESEMRAIGADLVWQSWLGRSKAQLNTKLAQVLAIKEQHLKQVRVAYGKLLVVQELIDKGTSDGRKKVARDALSRATSQSLFR
jgi:hypothetical protein